MTSVRREGSEYVSSWRGLESVRRQYKRQEEPGRRFYIRPDGIVELTRPTREDIDKRYNGR